MSVKTVRSPIEAGPVAAEAQASSGESQPRADVLTLDLADLIQDANGEIVLFNDSHLPALALRTDAQPVEEGEVGRHTTASGEDVSGFHYVTFNNGLTVFFKNGADLLIVSDNAC